MNVSRERRGSALLIVLGFVAFLIVSAVTFSIYMRQSRLPSSYLRRTATSRQLVKAALARAIDFTESCIRNDPHPNVRTDAASLNRWYGRVLTGVDENALVSVSNTVPTLTLEGLAYIPPPLVNAVRYYSRRTPTAMWQRFGYDTGRYAFAVVDVSDYFDVNRMFADKGRSSAANRRVSLAYLFEDGADHSSPPSKAGDWDDFMDDFRKVEEGSLAVSYDGKYPLISVCDLNLAMGKEDVAGFKSYFCDYIGAQGNRAGFYNTKNEDDEDRVERMTFVTDSIPSGRKSTSLAAGTETPVADLADADNQPFKMADLEKENASAYKVMLGELCQTKNTKPHDASGNPVTEPSGGDFLWQNHISGLGLAALWDYLDTDSYPISLAVPTTERHAMICGIEPMLKNDPALSIVRTVSHEPGSPLPNAQPGDKSVQMKTTVKYSLTLKNLIDQASLVKVATVYPFSHADELGKEDMKFTVDGVFKLFFSNQKMTLRTSTGDKLHPDASGFTMPTAISPELGQISINLSQGGVPVAFDAAEVKEEKDAVKLVSGSGGTSVLSLGNATALETEFKNNKVFLELEYNWVKPGNAGDTDQHFKSNIANNPGAVNKLGQPNLTSAHTDWRPLDAEGKPVDNGFDDDSLLSKLRGGYSASPATFYFNAAIWLRVKSSGDGERVVDMVPACFEDDKQSGGSSGGGASAQLMSEIGKEICGRTYPLFRFDTNGGKGDSIEFAFSVERLDDMSEAPKTVKLYPKSAIVADPRWNFAPEYWYSLGGTLSEDAWLKNCHRDQGDGDIFMATSDQGYLQSIYELAFLPRFKSLVASNGGAQLIGSLTSLERASADDIAPNFDGDDGIPNSSYMWRMFDPMDDDEDAFDKLPFASIGRGMRVNPYSDSTNVIMAAFANTPASWRVASTNNEEELESLSAADYNKKYAYCAYADDESRKVKWSDMKALAREFMDKIRNSHPVDWSKVWDDLDWFGDEKELWGQPFSSQNTRFWGADKRFLYGYWRDCFAAEQQLFLVFVRAEPLMMGGGEIGQTPPQLGARAVALVWRDPKAPADASAPHKTRVLFYRQFE